MLTNAIYLGSLEITAADYNPAVTENPFDGSPFNFIPATGLPESIADSEALNTHIKTTLDGSGLKPESVDGSDYAYWVFPTGDQYGPGDFIDIFTRGSAIGRKADVDTPDSVMELFQQIYSEPDTELEFNDLLVNAEEFSQILFITGYQREVTEGGAIDTLAKLNQISPLESGDIPSKAGLSLLVHWGLASAVVVESAEVYALTWKGKAFYAHLQKAMPSLTVSEVTE